MKAVNFENVAFSYREEDEFSLKNVSFSVEEGEFVAVLGHNGSGKSTLARLTNGLLHLTGGKITVFGTDVSDEKNLFEIRKKVGIVFQNPDNQTVASIVEDDIAFGLENECVPTEKMADIIKDCAGKVGMLDYLDSEPSNLSGGQKQRVAIAGAIARHPKVLILDEAGAMLDPKGKKAIRQIIKERKKEEPDLTVINITHEIDEAYDADRVLVLAKGQLVMDATPSIVFSKDEALREMGLDLPFAHKLIGELKTLGMDVGSVDDEEELIKRICR